MIYKTLFHTGTFQLIAASEWVTAWNFNLTSSVILWMKPLWNIQETVSRVYVNKQMMPTKISMSEWGFKFNDWAKIFIPAVSSLWWDKPLCPSCMGDGNNMAVLLTCVIVTGEAMSHVVCVVCSVCVCVQACAHRWKNVFYSKKDGQNHKLPNGVCYRYANDLRHAQPIIPCYKGIHTDTHTLCIWVSFSLCQCCPLYH